MLVRAQGRYSPDVRRPQVHLDELDPNSTLGQAGVQPRDFVEVAVSRCYKKLVGWLVG